jgi:hypothetical protein
LSVTFLKTFSWRQYFAYADEGIRHYGSQHLTIAWINSKPIPSSANSKANQENMKTGLRHHPRVNSGGVLMRVLNEVAQSASQTSPPSYQTAAQGK